VVNSTNYEPVIGRSRFRICASRVAHPRRICSSSDSGADSIPSNIAIRTTKKPDGSVDHRPTRTKCPTTAGTAGGDPSSASSEDPLPLPDGILPRRTTDRSRSGRGGGRAPRSGPDGSGETTVAGRAFWRPTSSSRARSLESTNHFDAARISCRRRRCDENTTADGRTVNDADNRRCKMAVCGSAPLLLARRCVYFEEAKPLRLYKS